jgi:hypothetical protein
METQETKWKKCMVLIDSSLSLARMPVPGYCSASVPGIAIHKAQVNKSTTWNLTHVESGRRFLDKIPSRAIAMRVAEAIQKKSPNFFTITYEDFRKLDKDTVIEIKNAVKLIMHNIVYGA